MTSSEANKMKEYPTAKELETIKNWDFTKQSLDDFLCFVESIWKYADIGFFKLTGTRVLKLELHTGGWSGNEDTISIIQDNDIFWMMCWEKSLRGGHYYFKIRRKLFKWTQP